MGFKIATRNRKVISEMSKYLPKVSLVFVFSILVIQCSTKSIDNKKQSNLQDGNSRISRITKSDTNVLKKKTSSHNVPVLEKVDPVPGYCSKEQQITNNKAEELVWRPRFHPNNEFIFYLSTHRTGRQRLWKYDLQKKRNRLVRELNTEIEDFALNGDGSQIVYTAFDALDEHRTQTQLYLFDFNQRKERLLFSSFEHLGGPLCWSPDGEKIALKRGKNKWLIDAKTKQITQLTHDEYAENFCDIWTNDSMRLFYRRKDIHVRPHGFRIWSMLKDGSDKRPFNNDIVIEDFTISRDGKHIYYYTPYDGVRKSFLNDKKKGRGPVVFSGGASGFDLSPDEKCIVFTYENEEEEGGKSDVVLECLRSCKK